MEPLARVHHLDVGEVGHAHDLHQELEGRRDHGLRGDDGGEDRNHQGEVEGTGRHGVEEGVRVGRPRRVQRDRDVCLAQYVSSHPSLEGGGEG